MRARGAITSKRFGDAATSCARRPSQSKINSKKLASSEACERNPYAISTAILKDARKCRHVGGAEPNQAVVRNARTCRPDVRGVVEVLAACGGLKCDALEGLGAYRNPGDRQLAWGDSELPSARSFWLSARESAPASAKALDLVT